MSMAVSELPNLHFSISIGEHDLYKLFLTNIDVLGQGITTVIPKTIQIIANCKGSISVATTAFTPLVSRHDPLFEMIGIFLNVVSISLLTIA